MKKFLPMIVVAIVATAPSLNAQAQVTKKGPPARPAAAQTTPAVKAAVNGPACAGRRREGDQESS